MQLEVGYIYILSFMAGKGSVIKTLSTYEIIATIVDAPRAQLIFLIKEFKVFYIQFSLRLFTLYLPRYACLPYTYLILYSYTLPLFLHHTYIYIYMHLTTHACSPTCRHGLWQSDKTVISTFVIICAHSTCPATTYVLFLTFSW